MSDERTVIRTADICDDYEFEARVCELQFRDFAAREDFHGEVVTFSTFESNKGIMDLINQGGEGKVLIIDGHGSARRALCGGNIAADAQDVCKSLARSRFAFLSLASSVFASVSSSWSSASRRASSTRHWARAGVSWYAAAAEHTLAAKRAVRSAIKNLSRCATGAAGLF